MTTESATPQLTADEEAELRRLADLMVWSRETVTEPWDYDGDGNADSIYAQWIRLLSPEFVTRILASLDEARGAAA